jgi:hypothetical protein
MTEIINVKSESNNNTNISVNTDFEKVLNLLNFNLDISSEKVRDRLEKYNDIDISKITIEEIELSIKEIKEINKDIENIRVNVRDIWNEPYDDFTKKIKVLKSLVDNAETKFSEIINKKNEVEKKAKQDTIRNYWGSLVAPIEQYLSLPISKVYKKEFDNKTKTLTSIKKELDELATKIKADVDVIQKDFEGLDIYFRTYGNNFDIADCYKQKAEIDKLAEQKAKAEIDRQRKADEEEFERAKIESERKLKEMLEAERKKAEEEEEAKAEVETKAEKEKETETKIEPIEKVEVKTVEKTEPTKDKDLKDVKDVKVDPLPTGEVKKVKIFEIELSANTFKELQNFLTSKEIKFEVLGNKSDLLIM